MEGTPGQVTLAGLPFRNKKGGQYARLSKF
jgi:hypothetical protein